MKHGFDIRDIYPQGNENTAPVPLNLVIKGMRFPKKQ
jgi:hypothetical protein